MHSPTNPEPSIAPASADAGEPRRFLVVDDDPDARALVAHTLRRDGAYVVEACGGLELMEWAERLACGAARTAFDAIVSDIRMPGYSALDVLTKLPTLGRKAPVVLMSAFDDPEARARAYDLGAALVLNKPLYPDDLRALLRAVVRHSSAF
jgi:CheY-like chemotaxis protein